MRFRRPASLMAPLLLLVSSLLVPLALVPLVGCGALGSTPVESAADGTPLLEGRSVSDWSARLEPDQKSLEWRSIPWHPTYHEGAIAASEAGKPLLLWLMNGHPLGCT